MGTRSKSANSVESDVQRSMPSTIVAQPWWRGPGFGATAPPSADPDGGDVSKHAGQSQVHDKVDNSADVQKQMQTLGIPTGYVFVVFGNMCIKCYALNSWDGLLSHYLLSFRVTAICLKHII